MSNGARGDEVRSGFGVRSHVVEGDAAGDLHARPPCQMPDQFRRAGGGKVIQQQVRRARGERFIRFGLRADFHLDDGVRRAAPLRAKRQSALDGGAYSSRRGDVVVLNQNRVEQADAMIPDAARRGRPLFQQPQAGRGFPGVQDAGGRAAHRIDKARRHGRHAAQPLEEIQGDALAGEQRPGRAAHLRHDLVRGRPFAVLLVDLESVHPAAHFVNQRQQLHSRQHQVLPRQEPAAGLLLRRDAGQRGQVARADVLGQSAADQFPRVRPFGLRHG